MVVIIFIKVFFVSYIPLGLRDKLVFFQLFNKTINKYLSLNFFIFLSLILKGKFRLLEQYTS